MKLTNPEEQCPNWEAKSPSDSQEIPRILRSPTIPYLINKIPPLVDILSQISPVHALQS